MITTIAAPSVFGTTSFFRPDPPSVGVRATSDVWMLSLYHPAHEALRRENPRAAEALAVAILRALSERFDLMDQLLSDYITRHPGRIVADLRVGRVPGPALRRARTLTRPPTGRRDPRDRSGREGRRGAGRRLGG